MMRDYAPNPTDLITLEPAFTAPLPCACASQPIPVAEPSSTTESVCPDCLARIPARRVTRGDDVYLEKSCPQHGDFQTIIWRGQPAFAGWVRPKIPTAPQTPFTAVANGCPFDCGLCPDHRQHTCTALLEVTQRCNLHCPFCFADADDTLSADTDPSLAVIEGWFRRLLEAGGLVNVQLSGGEPTVRDDLPEIVALGRALGFRFIQLNTNGIRLARQPAYLQRLKGAGLASVFLQFDGLDDAIYQRLRGAKLIALKKAAIAACAEQGIGVVLVPTVVPGVNDGAIGAIIEFALRCGPVVRGVHFQPVSYFGRYPQPPADRDRLTIPDLLRAIEAQTGGRVQRDNLRPSGCENALCSFHGNFVRMPDGTLQPWSQPAAHPCCPPPADAASGAAKTRKFTAQYWSMPNTIELQPTNGPELGGWDQFLARVQTHTFSLSGMAFQDAWNLDLERLRDCCIHTVSPDGRIIPFCAYNLTDRHGQALYRNRNA